jgi:hypothetical protein
LRRLPFQLNSPDPATALSGISSRCEPIAIATPPPCPAFTCWSPDRLQECACSRTRPIGKSIGCGAGDGAGHDGPNPVFLLSVLQEVVGHGRNEHAATERHEACGKRIEAFGSRMRRPLRAAAMRHQQPLKAGGQPDGHRSSAIREQRLARAGLRSSPAYYMRSLPPSGASGPMPKRAPSCARSCLQPVRARLPKIHPSIAPRKRCVQRFSMRYDLASILRLQSRGIASCLRR